MAYRLHHADCIQWLDAQPENSFEAIITDPPYGLKEYSTDEQAKLRDGNRIGIWRIPPTLKPQRFMRYIVRVALPLGEGTILEPFMGGGSTIAAAEYVGYTSVGVELDEHYYNLAVNAIPLLTNLYKEVTIPQETKVVDPTIQQNPIIPATPPLATLLQRQLF